MPASFPSHAAAVLPLKLWRPTWFDGVALVVGAAMPDMAYVTGCCAPPQTYGHTWWGTLLTVPVTLVVVALLRWAAPVVAAHLPTGGPLALRDYGTIGAVRHRWRVSALSAWIGAASHVAWDHLTHESIAGTGIGLPGLGVEAIAGVPWWMVVHLASTILGALAWLAMTIHIGRNRLLVRWHGLPPPQPLRPRLFWMTTVTVSITGIAVVGALTWLGRRDQLVPFLIPVPRPSVLVVRAALAVGAAILLATLAVRRATRPALPVRCPTPTEEFYSGPTMRVHHPRE